MGSRVDTDGKQLVTRTTHVCSEDCKCKYIGLSTCSFYSRCNIGVLEVTKWNNGGVWISIFDLMSKILAACNSLQMFMTSKIIYHQKMYHIHIKKPSLFPSFLPSLLPSVTFFYINFKIQDGHHFCFCFFYSVQGVGGAVVAEGGWYRGGPPIKK